MVRLLGKRTLLGAFTLWAISVVVFLATETLPGDPARAILGRTATPARLAALREHLHLTGSPLAQYFHWLKDLGSFNFGHSLANGEPVGHIIGTTVVNSSVLMLCAAVIAIPLSIVIGTWSALKRDTRADGATSVVTLVLAALPEFVIGVFLIVLFATGLFHALPAVFVVNPGQHTWSDPKQLVLPVLTLVLAVSPYIVRIMRATMQEVFESEYVQQAQLKGLPERTVIWRHALPNSIGPVAQVIALQLAWLLGGVVLVEYLFRYPGIGFQLTDAVNNRDLPVIQGLTLAIALFYIMVNLLADAITLIANPRVRTSR